jgi:hypothetical protein
MVLVACHEIPDTNSERDPRIEFIEVPFKAPSSDDHRGQMIDKGRKVHTILNRIKQLGVGHYMQVDADDLVSRRIVEFVARKADVPGWVIRLGYEYRVDSNFVQLNPTINRHCGTTHIVGLQDSDLPQDISDVDSPDAPARYVLRRAHHTWASGFAKLGRSFRTLPFVGCVYVTGYSDNHSVNRPTPPGRRRLSLRRLILAASPKIALSSSISDEFGF